MYITAYRCPPLRALTAIFDVKVIVMSHLTFTHHELPTKNNVQYEKLRKSDHENECCRASKDLDAMQSPIFESFQRSQKIRRNWIFTGMVIALSILLVVLAAQLVLLSLQYKAGYRHKYDPKPVSMFLLRLSPQPLFACGASSPTITHST